jgi:hypothetical protein
MTRIARNLAFIAAMACTAATQAAPVNIDFSALGLAEGQSVEGSTFSGATFTSQQGNLSYTGSYGAGIANLPAGDSDIVVSFAGGVTSVSVRAGDGAGDDDAFSISAYALGSGTFLGTFNSPVFGGANEPEWYTLTVSGLGLIGQIVFDPGNSGVLPGVLGGLGGVIITDLNFDAGGNDVPEPASLGLLALGLVGMAGLRRRRC